MKKLLLYVVLCSFLTTAHAQNIPFTIRKSEIFKDKYKESSIVSVDDDDNGGIVIVRSYLGGILGNALSGYYFEHYDANMKLVKEFEYPVEDVAILGMIVKNGTINIIENTYSKENKEYVFNAKIANVNDFAFTDKKLFTIKRQDTRNPLFSSSRMDGDRYAGILLNNDKSAFGISLDIYDKEGKSEIHKIYVYNTNMDLKIEHVFKRNVKDRNFKYENIDLSNDGTSAYLLGKVKTKESKKKEGGNYQYELTRITNTDSKTQVFDTEEHYAASLRTVFKDNKIACVGFYSDRNDSRFKGLCYFDMDPVTLKLQTSKYNPFTEQFMIDKYGKDKDKELKFLVFKDLFVTKNNDIIFNGEEYYITTRHHIGSTAMQSIDTYDVYHYDDIVSAKISNNGDLLWARNINKRQVTAGSRLDYVSYTSMVKGNDTYFFINTADKVTKLRNQRIQFDQKSPKRSNLYVIHINNEGEFNYKELLDDDDNEVPFMVANGAVSKQGDAVYFIGRKGKKKQLLKLKAE